MIRSPKYYIFDFVGEELFALYCVDSSKEVINILIEKNIDNPIIILGYEITKDFIDGGKYNECKEYK